MDGDHRLVWSWSLLHKKLYWTNLDNTTHSNIEEALGDNTTYLVISTDSVSARVIFISEEKIMVNFA